ncbi:L-serine ammonia-lyase, iron-sulfur-dependent, subunit alpha [Oceanivirga miroungae]|uniref:L-serine ammonia-lyase n=1 Tax=Oceanivirga miroungae TaxID=1130046 RepID=A0A6I8MCE3_9FUSO|nr:L-serine ammonia-lyase, iron-sulfur-dependent, subunit alpha [Oceanivirga miroungae]VWL85099.1 L-serine dehydratase 1 [Oceanivirga miroungae]
MDSLKELFKIGRGPSSSHTIGPERASKIFKNMYEDCDSYNVYLYGSLAATGKGHMTDKIIIETLAPKKVNIYWDASFVHPYHTNYLKFVAIKDDKEIGSIDVFSVGGGTIEIGESKKDEKKKVYKLTKLKDIIAYCKEKNITLYEYVEQNEGKEIWDFLKQILNQMQQTIENGLSKDGYLPAKIKVKRKAKDMYKEYEKANEALKLTKKIFAYALATSEENASNGTMVTAPTCGACGVIPSVLIALKEEFAFSDEMLIRSLAIAGLIGNLIKENATISGAEGGCQAEIGSATSMAAAMAAFLFGANMDEIEYAAESGLEHALGMTCDPIGGYVIIPCIERNAVFAVKALNTANFVVSVGQDHVISFDDVVVTMAETGRDLIPAYRETSTGGLAKYYEKLLNKEK